MMKQKDKLTVLDLFSGIGGFSLGLERAGFETISFSEIEPFCCDVLKKHWPDVPIAGDIKNLSYKDGKLYDSERVIYEGKIDLICGGFPCQPFSIAGRKKGKEDDRDLWPQMFRVIQEVKPSWVIGENVANFINMAFTRTKIDLESEGYRLQPLVIPACAVNAPHRRDRVWIIAYSDYERCSGSDNRQERQVQDKQDGNVKKNKSKRERRKLGSGEASNINADTQCDRLQRELCKDSRKKTGAFKALPLSQSQYWSEIPISSPFVCGVDDGIPNRSHRLKSLGNAVVPQIPEIIGQAIIKSMKVKK